MSFRTLLAALVALIAIPFAAVSSASAAERPFSLRFSDTTNGAIALAGNTLATCRAADANCLSARQGTGPMLNNNDFTMTRVNVLSGDGAATAASSATLTMPDDATVLFAGLYWQARSRSGGAARWDVALTGPNGRTVAVTAGSQDTFGADTYSAFADVTPLISSGGSGSYTVSNVTLDVDAKDKFGGWALVVAYGSRTEPPRNLSIFDGAREVAASAGKNNITIPVSGFLTPPTGQVTTEVGFVAGEGDLASKGDYIRLNGVNLQNALNPADNVANATVTRLGVEVTDRNPAYPNQLGWDVDTFNGNGILGNGASTATINATTSGETYYPQVLSLATEVYAPEINLVKSVTDVNGGQVERGDVLEYRIVATNTGTDSAVGAILRDPVPGSTDYVPGSITVNGASVTDAADGDAGAFYSGSAEVLAALGTGSLPGGGTLAPGALSTVTFRTTVRDSVPNNGSVTNAARADYAAATGGIKYGSESNIVPSAITAPDLTISKTASDFAQGGRATWTIKVRNVGGTKLTSNILVSDDIPDGVTAVSARGTGWDCETALAKVLCQHKGPVAVGQVLPEITMTGTVGNGARVVNVARVTSAQDQNAENDYALTENVFDVPKVNVDFATTIQVNDRRPVAGDRITATATYLHFDGVPSASTATLSFPTSITPRSATVIGDVAGNCSISGFTVTCDLASMKEGQSVRVVVSALVSSTVSGGTTIVSEIQPTDGNVDPAQGNNTAAVIVGILPVEPAVAPPTTLSLTKSVAGAPPAYGHPVTWRMTVTNTGDAPATNTYFQDQLPATASYVSGSVTGGPACENRGGVVRCNTGTLAPGESATANITVTYDLIGEITNGVTAYADGGVRVRASASTNAYGSKIGVRITTPKRWPISSTAQARVTIRGLGPLKATGTTLSVTLPANVRVAAAPGFRITRRGDGTTVLTRRTGTLRQGVSRSFTITLRTPATATGVRLPAVGTATNTARATSTTPARTAKQVVPVTG